MKHRIATAALVGLGWAVCAGVVWSDEWASPEPTSFHCRGFSYVAEIFPPKSRQNPTDAPVCCMYAMGYPGLEWKIDAKLVWKAPLVNAGASHMPYQAVVSMDGVLVTLDDYGELGGKNAVVIYDKVGNLVKSYSLDDLMTKEDLSKVESTVSSRWWTTGAKYYFLTNPDRLYIALRPGKTMEFMLKDGAFRYGLPPDVAAVLKKPFPNEEAEVWATSLRFSSITDVVAANAGKPPAQANRVNLSELNEAVAIGLKTLAEMKEPREENLLVGAERKEPKEEHLLVGAERIFLKGAYVWRLTFKPARLLPVDPAKQEIGAGGEIFINIDLRTKKAEVRYGE